MLPPKPHQNRSHLKARYQLWAPTMGFKLQNTAATTAMSELTIRAAKIYIRFVSKCLVYVI